MAERNNVPARLEGNSPRVVLEHLFKVHGGVTRPDLARAVGLTSSAVNGLIPSLAPVLERDAALRAQRGRRPEKLRIKADLGYVVGIALAHTQIRVAVADLHGNPAAEPEIEESPVDQDLHAAFCSASGLVQRLTSKIPLRSVAGIGLAIAAPVHVVDVPSSREFGGSNSERRATLRLDLGPKRRESQWLNIDPLAALRNHLEALPDGPRWRSVPIHVDNDANLGALAELRRGAARASKDLLYVKVDEAGIGMGLVFDGQVYRGAGGIAGELGHVVLEPGHSAECPRCGRPCVEAVIGTILGYHHGFRKPSLNDLVRRAVGGDPDSRRMLDGAAGYLGRALAGFVTLLNVDHVLIGGPFPPQAYPFLVPPVMKQLDLWSISPVARDYVLELGALHDEAPLEGAIWLALERTRVDYLLRHVKAIGTEQGSN